MPKLLTRKLEESQLQPDPCDFSSSAENVMVEQQIPIEELKMRCSRYLDYLNSLSPAQGTIMLRASNFTVDSVQQMIASNPGASFIRVYYGIKETGEHALFMGLVEDSGSMETTEGSINTTEDSTEDPVFVDDCCSCPPRHNCQDDQLLEYQP